MHTEARFQDGWTFLRQPINVQLEEVRGKASTFEKVEIPHDWLIEDTSLLAADLAEAGWYRKIFQIEHNPEEKLVLRFDGVYMDSIVYLNGQEVCRWKNGYTSFYADLTPYLCKGEQELLVRAAYETPNSRWYSGAGIYRSVTLLRIPGTHLVPEGIYIVPRQEGDFWDVKIEAEIESDHDIKIINEVKIFHRIQEKETGKIIAESKEGTIPTGEGILKSCVHITVTNPLLWELKSPVLYEAVTQIKQEGEVLDEQVTCFGFRTITFDSERGFFLNGKHTKIQGVCEHHDLGCLGAAFHKTAMRRKMETLKRMGANAIRISHNMPAGEVVELADELGILLVSELYDMWERPKNKMDFARFFWEWYPKDTASWIRRDRNHPSIILWSIGNEIYDTHIHEKGQEITALLRDEVKKHDPDQNAMVTLASNYMPWENAQKCADLVKIAGYNYSEKYYEKHHEEHPDWIIYGSETASIVQSRGIYHFPAARQILTDDDEQCSSLGNSITSWGARSLDACITIERDTPYSLGQFIWTGTDYIGEPTPYHTKNSYFGQVDTAGFEKDSYYFYQAAWTDYKKAPMIHLYPYWDFNEGQIIDVGICSNLPEVELLVNGESLGRQKIDHLNGSSLTARWQVPYRKGQIQAIGYDELGNPMIHQERRSFEDAKRILLTADGTTLLPKEEDLLFVTIEAEDEQGNKVENANNRVEVLVSGAGRLMGLDNGDSTDYDQYKGNSRTLFSGKLLAVIARNDADGEVVVRVTSTGLETGELCFSAEGTETKTDHAEIRDIGIRDMEIPVRKIEIKCPQGNRLNREILHVELEANLRPSNASYRELEWSVTDDAGIPSPLAELKSNGNKAVLFAKGDGTCRVRCMTRNGKDHIQLISQMEFMIEGIGALSLDPYSFIFGGVYSFSKGMVGNGNERGIATARDGETQVGFENLDFGNYGSDKITVPIFALTDEEYPIQIWEGKPGEPGSELLVDAIYQKPSIWNVYQEETFFLKRRVKQIQTICFVLHQKVHIKGFSFERRNRAKEVLKASSADRIYGDHYKLEEQVVSEIGNNVSLEFHRLDFLDKGVRRITICGSSPIECNSIHLCIQGEEGESRQLLDFTQSEGMEERVFDLEPITGVKTITFLFLPGSRFDFSWFQFEE